MFNAPPNLLSTNQQQQQQQIPTLNMYTNNQHTSSSGNLLETFENNNNIVPGTNMDLIKQLLNSNPQLQMYLHQLANHQTDNNVSMLTTSNNDNKITLNSNQAAATLNNLPLFNQNNATYNLLQHVNYVSNHMPQQNEQDNLSMIQEDSQHVLSLYLSSEEIQELLMLDQKAKYNNTLNQSHQCIVNPIITPSNNPTIPTQQPLFTCSANNSMAGGENQHNEVVTSLQTSHQNLPLHQQKQNTTNIVRKHSPTTSDHQPQHQPIINLLYSASTTNNHHHMIQQQSSQFNMEISPSPSLTLQFNEMDFYDLQYMNQPLTDLPPQQYNRYIFDGCEFILPIRYSPIMRGSQVVFLGRGAYGHVIAANDTQSGATVAIKKVQNVFDKAAYRMLREVKIMRHLRGHPNIVTLIDIFIPGNTLNEFKDLYIVSECMNGDLGRVMTNLCNQKQCLSIDNIRDIMGQLLSAMYYLQSAGVLHRDMKPSNILLSQKFQVKLSDFGMSRNEATNQQVTNPQSFAVVTEIYRPPEVVLNYEIQTSAIDSWSVGCIFAELLYMLPPSSKRRPLFVILKDSEIRAPNHYEHLNLMASLLGKPKTNELKGNPQYVQELLQLLENFPSQGYDFSLIFPAAPPEAIDLMKRFLTWNPESRISFEEALNHPFIRSSSMINRIRAEEKIGSLDDDVNVSPEKIKFLFYKEIVSWKSENKSN